MDWKEAIRFVESSEIKRGQMLMLTNWIPAHSGYRSINFAPWHVLESVDKKYARIKALKIVIAEIEKALKDK